MHSPTENSHCFFALHCFTVRNLLSFIECSYSILFAPPRAADPEASSVLSPFPHSLVGDYPLSGRGKWYSSEGALELEEMTKAIPLVDPILQEIWRHVPTLLHNPLPSPVVCCLLPSLYLTESLASSLLRFKLAQVCLSTIV